MEIDDDGEAGAFSPFAGFVVFGDVELDADVAFLRGYGDGDGAGEGR